MNKNNKLNKLNSKLVLLIIGFVGGGFILMIYISGRQTRNYKAAGFETKIDSTYLTGNEKFGGGLRGAVFYKKDWFVNNGASLVENDSGFTKWAGGGPLIDFDSTPYTYTLGDLGFPYSISKWENNDTLVVTKNGYVLKFLIVR